MMSSVGITIGTGDRVGSVLCGGWAVSGETLGFADRPRGRGALVSQVV
jgi:hypothetical protein